MCSRLASVTSSKMDTKLCETSFTGQKLEKLLLSTLLANGKNGHSKSTNGLRLIDVDARPMGIQGYLSKVLQIRLTWNRREIAVDSSPLPDSVIVKCPTSVNLQRLLDKAYANNDELVVAPDASLQIRSIHNDECAIYQFLYSGEIIEAPIPRYFGHTLIGEGDHSVDEGVLILEDLSHKGTVMKTLGQKLNRYQIETLAVTLAKLHAWSYIRFSRKEENEKMLALPGVEDRMGMWSSMFCISPDVFRQLKTEFADIFFKVPTKMLDLFSEESFVRLFGSKNQEHQLPVVLVHGDVQPMNILFSTGENDKNRLVGLIDWQMAHKGCGVEDLARLLTICSTHEIKTEHGDEILQRYVDTFNEKIRETGLDPISFVKVKSIFNRMYSFMALTFATSVRIVDELVAAVQDAEEREKLSIAYVKNCQELCQDAMETLGW